MGHVKSRSTLVAAALCGLFGHVDTPRADDFFKGKAVNIVVGFGPGGGYDTYARLLARHYGRHIPGNPSIVPQNMPGGGSLVSANHLFNVAPKDGTHLAMFGAFTNLEPLFNNSAAKFDGTKFNWIGSMTSEYSSCAISGKIPYKTFDDLKARELVFGSSGQGSNTTQHVMVLNSLLGMKARIVQGYKGTNDLALALARGEIEATCGIFVSTARILMAPQLNSGEARIFVQFGRKDSEDFRGAVNIYNVLTSQDDKDVADIVFRPNEAARAVAAPPGLPTERVTALREAFDKTIADPQLLVEAEKMSLPIEPLNGAQVDELFKSIYKTPVATVKRSMTVMGIAN
jgi:tripartite-type tricarboxylate transporter receptor subunit TctC